jgi:1-aminocyclopropane-1-carboxylate deaminase
MLEQFQKPPLQTVLWSDAHKINVLRLDEMHPIISGNKWFKLKYNLQKIEESNRKFPELSCKLITFGGAYSNHIHACAKATQLLGIPAIGYIRGENPDNLSPTLQDAHDWGMQLEFISRDTYAEKDTEDFHSWLYEQHGHCHIVPEGGSNFLGINGCMEILEGVVLDEIDTIVCAMGTGTTVAGLLLTAPNHIQIIGVPVLKGGRFLEQQVAKELIWFLGDEDTAAALMQRFTILDNYHFGGYGKTPDDLFSFMQSMQSTFALPLDKIYTAKAFYALIDNLPTLPRPLFIHTGGLQGNR